MALTIKPKGRGHTAVSVLKPGEIDWESIFGSRGVGWFHAAGIFCAFSETTPELEAVQVAHKFDVVFSYDLNDWDSLWKLCGGKHPHRRSIAVSLLTLLVRMGNEEDFSAALGYNAHDREGFRQRMQPCLKDARNRTPA